MGSVGSRPFLWQESKSGEAICRPRNKLVTRGGKAACFQSSPVRTVPSKLQELKSKPRMGPMARTATLPTGRRRAGRRKKLRGRRACQSLPRSMESLAHRKSRRPSKYEDDRALFQVFSEKNVEAAEKPKTAKKKWMIIAPVSAASVLLLAALMFPLFHHGASRRRNHPFRRLRKQPTRSRRRTFESAGQCTRSSNPACGNNRKATGSRHSGSNGQGGVKPAPGLTKKQTKMMDDQLTAPTVIPQGAGKQGGECAAPGELWLGWRGWPGRREPE